MSLRVHVSGLYSGPSPSPGIGVALSLKSALPDLKLIGIDHYAGSSGLRHSGGGRFKEETFLSTGFATAAVCHLHPFAVGVKSIAGIGAHDQSEDMALTNSDIPLRRYVQHVSISPYLGYRRSFGNAMPFGLQLEIGPVSAISSLKH